MSYWKPIRKLYIRTTNLTHGFQGKDLKFVNRFYDVWSKFYDQSISLDPAYQRELNSMIDAVVFSNDYTADLGCGTGLGTLSAASKASKVIAIDPNPRMTDKLLYKINKYGVTNIELRNGYFPDVIKEGETFDSIISSFMLAHLTPEVRSKILGDIFEKLNFGGRVGLFSAQGEIASSFQTRQELVNNLINSGFANITVQDVSDIYRITTAVKPST